MPTDTDIARPAARKSAIRRRKGDGRQRHGRRPGPVTLGADEWLARLAELPLAFQPGEGCRYHQSFAETKREDQSFDSRLVAVGRTNIDPTE